MPPAYMNISYIVDAVSNVVLETSTRSYKLNGDFTTGTGLWPPTDTILLHLFRLNLWISREHNESLRSQY